MTQQLDLYRHSPEAMAQACREAAASARVNPYEAPDDAERRARHYEAEARRYEEQMQR